jgi:hypothetical protein
MLGAIPLIQWERVGEAKINSLALWNFVHETTKQQVYLEDTTKKGPKPSLYQLTYPTNLQWESRGIGAYIGRR